MARRSASVVQPVFPVPSVAGAFDLASTLPSLFSLTSLRSSGRLKLRCDRAVPCGSCVKRGCAAICPDGLSLPSLAPSSVLDRPFMSVHPQALSPLARAIGKYSLSVLLPLLRRSHSAHPDSSSHQPKICMRRSINLQTGSENLKMRGAWIGEAVWIWTLP